MLKLKNVLVFFCSILIGVSIQATTQEISTKTTDENATENTNFIEKSKLSVLEHSKCHRLKKALVGEHFDMGRIAAYLSSNAIGSIIQGTLLSIYAMKKYKNLFKSYIVYNAYNNEINVNETRSKIEKALEKNLPTIIPTIGGTILAMQAACIALHFGLLKKQNISGITSAFNSISLNPTGLCIYSLLHRLVLSSNLIHVLETYDHDQIPACVKRKFTPLINEYEDTQTLSMNQFQKSQFVIKILAALDKAIAE